MKINIGDKYKPFIIAEMSGNHNGSLSNAIKIVKAAAQAGVSAIKLQTYTADTMTLNSNKKEFLINDKKSIWNGSTLYDLYKKAHTPWSWHKKIFSVAKANGLICFSTPFDDTAVKFLEKNFNPPLYKISSFENTDLRLIKIVAKTKKPMIISLGMASLQEIKNAVYTAKKNGCAKLILLKCTSDYPANPKDANLNSIEYLKKKFNCEIGLSDHTLGIGTSIAAIAKGAVVIEKHFKFSEKNKSVDSLFSMTPHQMKSLVYETVNAWKSLGKIKIGVTGNEKNNLKYRRSIYVVKNIKKNELFTSKNIKCIRPGFGLKTIYFEKIINKRAKKNLIMGTPLKKSMIK